MLNGLLTGVNKLTDALGSLGSVGLGAGLIAGIKNVGRPKNVWSQNCFELPTTISVLSDTKVFLWSVVKYTMVNEAKICWEAS